MSKVSQEAIEGYIARCKEKIQLFGHMVQGVGEGENTPAYLYTIGRSLVPGRSELILIESIGFQPVVNSVAKQMEAVESTQQDTYVFTVDDYRVGNETLRVLVKKIKHIPSLADLARGWWNYNLLPAAPTSAYQIFLPDDNNKLRNEEGYTPWKGEGPDYTQ